MGVNTLTSLAPDLYEALDTISRELVGFIPAVTLDASAERAALGQNIRSFVAPAVTANTIVPAQLPPDNGYQTFNNIILQITQSQAVPFTWNGEEQKGMNSGPGYHNMRQSQMKQAMRVLVNTIEQNLASTYALASRATGTAGTTPFGSNLGAAAQCAKILDDNGAPIQDRQMVVDTFSGAAMRTLTQLNSVYAAGNDTLLRQGILGNLIGFDVRQSGQVYQSVAVGTASGATTTAAGFAVGTTLIGTAAAGTGTILAGDILTFVGDTNQYVVVSGNSSVASAGSITIAAPGLKVAMSAATKAITVVGAATRNMAFAREALVLVTRAPAIPEEGDMAVDSMMIQDPRSGLAFDVRMYKQYHKVYYEMGIAWGYQMIKPEHCALLLG